MQPQASTSISINPALESPDHATINLEQICEGRARYSTSLKLINRYIQGSEYRKLGFRAGQWFETTEQIYRYFLECLPPLHQTSGGFVVSECSTANLHHCFLTIDGRFFCAVVKWDGPISFSQIWTALLREEDALRLRNVGTQA